tara:strand:+ start:240 stop:569 length:330 start_codon:yes stop_codon:yes gene_type:complete
MKFLNDFKNLFAIVGVVSLIFWTCASDSVSNDSNDDSSLPPQITGGTYQVASITSQNGNYSSLVILNTETGVMKSYYRNLADNTSTYTAGEWLEGSGNLPGSGNLTVNH